MNSIVQRFENIKLPNNKGVAIIDYAHSPDALEKVFSTSNSYNNSLNNSGLP